MNQEGFFYENVEFLYEIKHSFHYFGSYILPLHFEVKTAIINILLLSMILITISFIAKKIT